MAVAHRPRLGQRVGLAQGNADRAGQFKGLLVMRACAMSPGACW
jgi:hypothetical protein